MRLVVTSYKPCWQSPQSATGFATDGGFPFQMAALSELFDGTTLVIAKRGGPPPSGVRDLAGHRLEVCGLAEPAGSDGRRKLALLFWLPRFLPAMLRQIVRANAVHAAVPGDLGALGLIAALILRKPLFIRHCGTWGSRGSLAERGLSWLLPRIAGGRVVVMATGGGSEAPSRGVSWIFSTTLSASEIERLEVAEPWRAGQPLRLVTVGRLTAGKNVRAVIDALPRVRDRCPGSQLEVVGDGPLRVELVEAAVAAGVAEAVRFHGNLAHSEVLRVLSRAHLLVFPTRVAEGFPKAVLEALACGVPVLASPVSVLPRLLGEGGGELLTDTSSAAVATAILELVAAGPERFRVMSTTARKTARGYTLETWQQTIRGRLEAAWRRPLRAPREDG